MPVLEVGKAEFFQAEVHCYLLSEALETSQSYHYPSLPLKIALQGSNTDKSKWGPAELCKVLFGEGAETNPIQTRSPFLPLGSGRGWTPDSKEGESLHQA